MSNFLDLLPDDLHENFVKHILSPPRLLLPQSYECMIFQPKPVLEEERHATLLNYARLGDKQQKAVMKVLDNKLFPYNFSFRALKDWISICRESICEINIEFLTGITLEAGFLDLPNLRKCTIRGVPDQLSAIRGSARLSDVTITVIRASLWEEMVSALASLPVTVLRFQFRIYGRMKRIDRIPTAQLVCLCKACPKIKQLELLGRVSMTTNLNTMISTFPMLKKLGLNCSIRVDDIPKLQRFEKVDLYKSHSIRIAAGLGKSLSSVTQEDVPASEIDIQKLSECPNLRRLIINLRENAEAALVGNIDNVEELCLVWTKTRVEQQDLRRAFPRNFIEPNGEVLQDVMRSAPKLKSLVLAKAVVKEEVLKKILEICGRHLVNLEVHVDRHGVPVPVRVETILRTVSKHCFKLRTLWLLGGNLPAGQPRYYATRDEKERCFKALRALKKATPDLLCYRNIELFLNSRIA